MLFVGIVNAWNFMDGVNGITGGYSLAVLLPLAYLNEFVEPFIDGRLLAVTAIAALVFCFFNFRTRARCFAGDVGSVSVAFIVLFALGSLVLRTGDLSWIVLLAVYGVDVVLTVCHRVMLHSSAPALSCSQEPLPVSAGLTSAACCLCSARPTSYS